MREVYQNKLLAKSLFSGVRRIYLSKLILNRQLIAGSNAINPINTIKS